MFNIVLDNDVILSLLSQSINDTQRCYTRVQKSPTIRFWIPCCLLPLLETQIFPVHHHPLETLLKNENVQLLSSLAAHWEKIPPNHPNKIQALISLDASALPGTTLIWTNHPDFISVCPEIEFGDHETIYAMLAQEEEDVKFHDLTTQQLYLRASLEKEIFNILKQEEYIFGSPTQKLELRLAKEVGSKHCITLANSTDALLIALMAVGVKEGNEVITSPFNSPIIAEMITLLGAKPVFVDIDSRTYNLNPLLLRTSITRKTKAIIPSNLYGQCADFDVINMIAAEHNLPVIEDATQSFGARYKDRQSGNLAMIGYTSFLPTHPLGTYGDGGACFTNDDKLAETIKSLRSSDYQGKATYRSVGLNSCLGNLQTAILLSKLSTFRKELEQRTKIGNLYTRLFKEQPQIKFPIITPYNSTIYSQYVIEIEHRNKVQEKLQQKGIPTEVSYSSPIHLQPAFAHLEKGVGNFPIAEVTSKRILSLPMHSYLNEERITHIVGVVKWAISTSSS